MFFESWSRDEVQKCIWLIKSEYYFDTPLNKIMGVKYLSQSLYFIKQVTVYRSFTVPTRGLSPDDRRRARGLGV